MTMSSRADSASAAGGYGIVQAWRAVRAVPEIGPSSDKESFFEAGRNFILLVVLQRELAREFGVRFPMCELAEHPTVAGLLALHGASAAQTPQRAAAVEFSPSARGSAPLSHAQERLWLAEQFGSGHHDGTMGAQRVVRVDGDQGTRGCVPADRLRQYGGRLGELLVGADAFTDGGSTRGVRSACSCTRSQMVHAMLASAQRTGAVAVLGAGTTIVTNSAMSRAIRRFTGWCAGRRPPR
ncbi:acyl carrier protein [Streptomyces actinomycinicus]|uniref:Acyl carrier protein n=1 Tax=Streptomyces actinomycinicus TaxID=1695166 RepID=A0A937JSG0_9ACTN|nr:acyl carrier protein [Streptomyces actinomycinicus]MBL1087431.1 acyl carrier protein [Streptomyces actinomycinicus]